MPGETLCSISPPIVILGKIEEERSGSLQLAVSQPNPSLLSALSKYSVANSVYKILACVPLTTIQAPEKVQDREVAGRQDNLSGIPQSLPLDTKNGLQIKLVVH